VRGSATRPWAPKPYKQGYFRPEGTRAAIRGIRGYTGGANWTPATFWKSSKNSETGATPRHQQFGVKFAFGTDIQFNPKGLARQSFYLPKLTGWFMATTDNAESLALWGPRNPYPGKLGVVDEGAFADLILVDVDPIANIKTG
jgi:imidazolonepropionase-like amidohydrolase